MSGHTPGPWGYIAANEHHGSYVVGPFGSDVCDCYTMSNLAAASVRNGGESYPVQFQGDQADANARLIAAAPDLLEALTKLSNEARGWLSAYEIKMRDTVGNTNYAVLKQRVDEATVALNKATGEQP